MSEAALDGATPSFLRRRVDPWGQAAFDPIELRVRVATLVGVGVVAILAFAALVVVGSRVAVPGVERHLRDDVTASVLVDYPGVTAAVHGRDVELHGTVRSAEERSRLLRRVGSRWGVARIEATDLRVANGSAPPSST